MDKDMLKEVAMGIVRDILQAHYWIKYSIWIEFYYQTTASRNKFYCNLNNVE